MGNGDKAFSQYGLENPSNVITVTTADKEVKILLGDTNGATGDCYMAVEGAGKGLHRGCHLPDAVFQRPYGHGGQREPAGDEAGGNYVRPGGK